MKNYLRLGLGTLTTVILLASSGRGWASSPEDKPADPVLANASGGIEMVRVTPKPQIMQAAVAMACLSAPMSAASGGPRSGSSAGLHDQHYFDVYVSLNGCDVMRSEKDAFPVGTLILKRKYSAQDAEGKVTELFTGMRKHDAGYNPQSGDWEYFVTSGDGKTVTSHGAMASCMACHQSYESSDFVTRDYQMSISFLVPKAQPAKKDQKP